MSNTSNLVLPYLAVGQAQKHVTVNETLRKLDAIVQLSVVSATTAAEPASPADGAVYILPSGKTGTHWSAYANHALAYYRDGAWAEIAPREGWLAFVRDTDLLLSYASAAWSLFSPAKILALSGADKLVGRSSSGAGAAEEIACTAAGRALIDDADAAAQRATLNAPGLATANAFSDAQTINKSTPAAGADGLVIRNTGVTANGHTTGLRFQYSAAVPAAIRATLTNDATGAARLGLFTSSDGSLGSLTERWGVLAAGDLQPVADNAYALGGASSRASVIYSATGTINTSDAREKTQLRPLSDAERRAVRRIFAGVGVYRWLGSIEEKGAAARLHCGVTAQDVAAAFVAEGLDPAAYALFCADPLTETVEVEKVVRIQRPAEEVGQDAGAAVESNETVLSLEQRSVRNAQGEPVMRLGVRYDQLLVMALAAMLAPDA